MEGRTAHHGVQPVPEGSPPAASSRAQRRSVVASGVDGHDGQSRGWSKPSWRAWLLGTVDPGSPVYGLAGNGDVLKLIYRLAFPAGRTKIVLDADLLHRVHDLTLRDAYVANLRDDLLRYCLPNVSLVLTDWNGTMPEEVRDILVDCVRAQGSGKASELTSLDLHGQLDWFLQELRLARATFENGHNVLQHLEFSLSDGVDLDGLPDFANLHSLRIYQPPFGSEQAAYFSSLLKANLPHLTQFACVASQESAAAPFTLAFEQLSLCESAARSTAPPHTSLWLHGTQRNLSEVLPRLGEVIARERVDAARASTAPRSFVGRLAELKLEVTSGLAQVEGLAQFRAYAVDALRDRRLGTDVHLGIHLSIRTVAQQSAQDDGLLCLVDFTPLTIGVESAGGLFLPVVPRNCCIPVRKRRQLMWSAQHGACLPSSRTTSSAHPDDSGAECTRGPVRVCQGERAFVADNVVLGEVELPADGWLEFDIDANGILRVNGTVLTAYDRERITADAIRAHLQAAEVHTLEDRGRRSTALAAIGIPETNFLQCISMYERQEDTDMPCAEAQSADHDPAPAIIDEVD